jgi:hypothetical protein
MLRAILAGMKNAMVGALSWCWGFAFALVTLPFRAFAPRQRQQTPALDLAAIKQRFASHALTPKGVIQSQMRDSQIAFAWIVGVSLDQAPRPLPSALSRTMGLWLQGLTYKQLTLLKIAGPTGIFDHVTGKRRLPLVPRLMPLPAVELVFPPAPRVSATAPRMLKVR